MYIYRKRAPDRSLERPSKSQEYIHPQSITSSMAPPSNRGNDPPTPPQCQTLRCSTMEGESR